MIISEALSKINLNSTRIAKLLKSINDEITELSSVVGQFNRERNANRVSLLKAENEELEKQVEKYKQELIQLRTANDVPQIPIASPVVVTQEISNQTTEALEIPGKSPSEDAVPTKKCQSNKTVETKQSNKTAEIKEASFGQLDIRVGKIVEVEKHPNADSLYVEKVEFGEAPSKVIISGLVNHVPIEEMKNRLALFLVNLKPVKMRNITSEGMIMCASDGDKVEILKPPEGSVPGDIVHVEGYEYKPESVLNPKKKILETLAPFLRVNENKIATFKNISWDVGGKGPAVTQSVVNAQIK